MTDLRTISKNLVNPATLSGALFYALAFWVFARLAARAVSLAVHRKLDGHAPTADQTAVRFLGQLARLGIYVIAIVSYAHLIPALHQLGTVWLASVGVVSVVVGIAAQNTLGNLISGIALLLYRPFQLGDRLQITTPTGLESGVVENLSLGYTTVRTDDDRKILIPHSAMASQTCINTTSRTFQRAACAITINLTYSADIDKARDLLIMLGKQHPKATEVAGCRVTVLTDAAVAVTLTVFCADSATSAVMKCDLLESIKKQFDAQGIPLAHN